MVADNGEGVRGITIMLKFFLPRQLDMENSNQYGELKAFGFGLQFPDKSKSIVNLCAAAYISKEIAGLDFPDDFKIGIAEEIESKWILRNYPPLYREILINEKDPSAIVTGHEKAYKVGQALSKYDNLENLSKEIFNIKNAINNG